MTATPPDPQANCDSDLPSTNLKPLRVRGSVVVYAFFGIVLSVVGLLLVTGLSRSPWLFLLYPLLIGLLLVSLSTITLHLLHRFGR